MKTKYRIISNGYWEFIQYKVEKFYLFGLICIYNWYYVPKPYYDKYWGRELDITGADRFITSLDEDLDEFPKKYPDISVYFKWFEDEQGNLMDKAIKDKNNRNRRDN
jgi:hypothetical protein